MKFDVLISVTMKISSGLWHIPTLQRNLLLPSSR